MLEGLEISEVMFSYVKANNDVFRFDSRYFQKQYLREEIVIRKKGANTLAALGVELRSFGAYSLNNEVTYLESGIPFIRGVNMKKGRVSFFDLIYISQEDHSLLWKSEVKPEMVLLSMSGTVGDVAIASKHWNYPINSNQDIAKIDTQGKLNPYYLYSFLLSAYGQNYLQREARGSVQQHVFLSQIERFEVPSFSYALEQVVQRLIEMSDSHQTASDQSYFQAEKLLLATLGMANFSPSAEAINIKSFKDSFAATGRLDAEYYQPRYEDFERLVVNHPLGYTTIASEYELVKQTSKRDKPAYNYIEIGDVNVSDGAANFNHIGVEELPDNAKLEVKRGDLLISKVRPNRGAVAIIDFDDTDLIVSGAFTVLREKETSIFHNETLKVLLRTGMYREWVLKFNIGTQYPVIRDEDILNLPIPSIDEDTQKKIAAMVQESFTLKTESERLLELAKKTVEKAIETSEAEALRYLEDHQGQLRV